MPTNVGPNTFGEENLVFGYDLGDVSNSYKGEPVQNLWDSMLNTQSLRTHTKHYWDGKQWIVDATYTHPGVEGPKGTYLGIVFKHTSGALSNTWSGTSYGYMLRDIACTNGATMTMSSWIYASTDCDVDAIPAVIEGESGGESTVTGYPAQYDLSNKGTWQVTAKKAISDGNTRFIPLYPRKGGVTDGSFAGFFMWALPQVTYGDHVVQPIQPGTTRSATQGLLDLTGNSTIDLTNVSFDSNAQMTFDGTGDYADLSNQLASIDTSTLSIEMVFKSTNTDTSFRPLLGINSDQTNVGYICLGNFTGHWSNESLSCIFVNSSGTIFLSFAYTAGSSTLKDNQFHHIVFNFQTNSYKIFVDGEEVAVNASFRNGSQSTPMISNLFNTIATPNITVGYAGSASNAFLGDIPVTKIYNRALTAEEIKSNFNAIKGRFNI